MSKPESEKKSVSLKWIAVAVIAIFIISIALYSLFAAPPAESGLQDPENDVQLNIGTEFPGMIDVVSATLQASGDALNVTIHLKDPVSTLGAGERAQWNVTVILEDDTFVEVYTVWADLNSTRLSGFVAGVEGSNASACQVEFHGSTLTLRAPVSELQSAAKAEWSILTAYEKYSGDELTVSAFDFAPDEGLHTTTLRA